MKKEDQEKLAKKLREREVRLKRQLQGFKEGIEMGSDVDHLEEEADEAEEYGTWLALKRVLGGQLDRIRLALAKMGIGSYGRCEQCRNEIELELLEVNPESTLCKSCKRKRGGR